MPRRRFFKKSNTPEHWRRHARHLGFTSPRGRPNVDVFFAKVLLNDNVSWAFAILRDFFLWEGRFQSDDGIWDTILYGNFLLPSYDETIGDPDDMTRWTFLQTHRRLFMRQDESIAMRIDPDFEERDAILLLYAMIHKVIRQRNIDIDEHESVFMASEIAEGLINAYMQETTAAALFESLHPSRRHAFEPYHLTTNHRPAGRQQQSSWWPPNRETKIKLRNKSLRRSWSLIYGLFQDSVWKT
ncbi:hypothetical protein DBV05_g1840 [Lasiodiplodia theobromae]|uniref:Uncharacterized protein n=1 Tax=Lasiodiplodia theobromae TaxID=45133 RepID=A0A5N5DN42_9PEZI|nr:hypothetical protein DBV05_g1840 [Lasiodiplodia theobromae]